MLAPEELVGQEFGKYTILEQIGKGGMGIVYKGRHRLLKNTVALKVLPALVATDKSMVVRFHREAEAAANLNHPNIVRVYDVGEEQGVHFIAMEYVGGNPLSTIIAQQGAMQPDRVLEIIGDVARGLGAAHEAGMVHRDIKPGNILIDKKGNAKIVDFGLVKSESTTRITSTGTLLGTVRYMSPEQCRGAEVDTRSDIFSLGVVMYRMLSGKRPFEADTPVAITHKIVEEEPVPVQKWRPDLLPSLYKIVAKMMAKDVEQRYQTVDELIHDIEECRRMLHSQTETVISDRHHQGVRGSFQSLLRKRWFRLLVRVAVALAIVAMAGFVYNLWKTVQFNRMAEEFGMLKEQMPGDRQQALAAVGRLMQEGEEKFDRGMVHDAADRFGSVLNLAPKHQRAKLGLGYCLADLGDFTGAEEMFRDAGSEKGHDIVGLASVRCRQGRFDEAKQLCEEAESAFPENPYLYTVKGDIYYATGELDKSIEEYTKSLETAQDPLFAWQKAVTHSNLGRAYADAGDTEQALQHYAKAAETYNARYRTEYALALQKADRYEEAHTLAESALEADPEDELASLLKSQIEQRMADERDEQRSRRFRDRLNELEKMWEEGRAAEPPERDDEWTSRPAVLSITMGDLPDPKLRPGFKELMLNRLTQSLADGGRVQPVEREIIDKLLEELQLGTSSLAEDATALRLGKLFAANIVGVGSMGLYDNAITVSLRLIDTQSSLQKASLMPQFDRNAGITEVAEAVAAEITNQIEVHYPLRAKVVEVTDADMFIVNIGSDQGLRRDVELDIYAAAADSTGATIKGRKVGLARTTSVSKNQAEAVVVEKSEDVLQGMLLVESADAS